MIYFLDFKMIESRREKKNFVVSFEFLGRASIVGKKKASVGGL